MTGRLMDVSKKLPPLLDQAQTNEVWKLLLDTPVEHFGVRKWVWDQFASSLTKKPPTLNPEALFFWTKEALWSLCVFVDPDDARDHDQYDLELWWSQAARKHAFVCGLGHHWEFRPRFEERALIPLAAWSHDTENLTPALRDDVVELYPDVELLHLV